MNFMEGCRRLEVMLIEVFENFGWKFSNRLKLVFLCFDDKVLWNVVVNSCMSCEPKCFCGCCNWLCTSKTM
jgi:hypothetical protein